MSPKPSRIVIVGISGTGKSAFARRVAAVTGLPVFHVDSILWGENWTELPRPNVELELNRIAQFDHWIIEGWIDDYSKLILERADVVIYLDFPGWVAAWGGLRRSLKHRREPRPELPEGCTDSPGLDYLKVMLLRQERPHIESVLKMFNPRTLLRCRSRKDAEDVLRELGNTG